MKKALQSEVHFAGLFVFILISIYINDKTFVGQPSTQTPQAVHFV